MTSCPQHWPTTHLLNSIPYFDSTQIFPCQYAGTIASNADGSHQLFYWMYAAANVKEKPIAIWLNGGPGSSSTLANFMFNGPMRI